MPNVIDPHEIDRDPTNWMDVTEPGWQSMDVGGGVDLLGRACADSVEVSLRYRIPDEDFMPPLETLASWVLCELVD